MLYGRDSERAVIDGLLADARAGRSRVLVIRGEAGIGKTALLEYAARSADMPVLRSVGVESEAQLSFAGLHLLLRGGLDQLDGLPAVQAAALRGALGMSSTPIVDRFLVGLAVLSALAERAEGGSLLCLVDDAQWVDQESMDALVFAARRLEAEGIVLLIAARDDGEPFDAPGLPELSLGRLDRASATRLLADCSGDLAVAARDRLLDQAVGNPLALIELSAASSAAQGAGRLADDVGALSVPRRIEQLFRTAVEDLPRSAQNLLLVVAADDTGELDLVLRAARALGASDDDLAVIEAARLIELSTSRVAFRHPLIRAATYHSAPTTARWAAHRALAEALHGDRNADRRAWHLASGITAPDDAVADALERTAAQARARSGIAAVAAASERAAELSTDEPSRARRLTAAAEAAAEVGQLDRAGVLVDKAAAFTEDPPLRARLARVRGHIDYAKGELDHMHGQLIAEVRPIVADEPQRAVWLLMELMFLSYATGDRAAAVQTADLLDDLRLPAGDPLLPIQRLLRSFLCQRLGTDTTGLPALPDTVRAALAVDTGGLRGRLLTVGACLAAGESVQAHEVTDALVSRMRTHGAIGLLPRALVYLSILQLQRGRHRDARATSAEAVRMARDTGQHEWVGRASGILAVLAAYQGDEEQCHALAQVGLGDGTEPQSRVRSAALLALALLDLSLGRADAALTRLEAYAATEAMKPWTVRCVPDLVEAAVYAGQPHRAAAPFTEYEEWAAQTRQPWIEAMLMRCRALLATDDEAEHYYTSALAEHGPGGPFEAARTALLYGEWLRRVRRRVDARTQLRAALETFEGVGAHPWADRARRELRASGETVKAATHPSDLFDRLTPQELQVVRLAATGLSNRAIAAQLFLSPRTVGYHLYKAYPKLGVTSRAELAALAQGWPAT